MGIMDLGLQTNPRSLIGRQDLVRPSHWLTPLHYYGLTIQRVRSNILKCTEYSSCESGVTSPSPPECVVVNIMEYYSDL